MKQVFYAWLLLLGAVTSQSRAQQQTPPHSYWSFDGLVQNCVYYSSSQSGTPPSPPAGCSSTMGYTSIVTAPTLPPQVIGVAGTNPTDNYFSTLGSQARSCFTQPASSPLGSNDISIEFLMRLDYDKMNQQRIWINLGGPLSTINATTNLFSLEILPQSDRINMCGTAITMNKAGVEDIGYIMDNQWHHFVMQRYVLGNDVYAQLWIDGQSPASFTKNLTAVAATLPQTPTPLIQSIINSNPATYANPSLVFTRSSHASISLNIDIDEIAMYGAKLPDNEIYAHFHNALQNQVVYTSTQNWNTQAPVAPVVTTDPLEALPSNYTFSPFSYKSTLEQLKDFAVPRYHPDNQLETNFSYWANMRQDACPSSPSGTGGNVSACISASNYIASSPFVIRMKELQLERAKYFRHNLNLGNATITSRNASGTYPNHEYVKLANQHPEFKTEVTTFWGGISPRKTCNETFDPTTFKWTDANNVCYSTNPGGGAIPRYKPYHSQIHQYATDDGAIVRGNPNSKLLTIASDLTRPLDYVQENGEASLSYMYNSWSAYHGINGNTTAPIRTCLNDGLPVAPNGADLNTTSYSGPLMADYLNAFGTSGNTPNLISSVNWAKYFGLRSSELYRNYRGAMLSTYVNTSGTTIIDPVLTKFSLYDLHGTLFVPDYEYNRTVNTPINDKYYGTDYFYAYSGPSRWRISAGNIRGMDFFLPSI